jgi:hypothetical protein
VTENLDSRGTAILLDERVREHAEVIALLATALDVTHPIDDLQARPGPGTLKFLVEELIASRDGLREAYARDHGGAPTQGPVGDFWRLHWQFRSDVWDEYSPRFKLQARVVALNPAAIAEFVRELFDWIGFIESSVPMRDSGTDDKSWIYLDPSSRESFMLKPDETNEGCDALLHAFEDHEFVQVATIGQDGISIWDEYINFAVPWVVLREADRRERQRRRDER